MNDCLSLIKQKNELLKTVAVTTIYVLVVYIVNIGLTRLVDSLSTKNTASTVASAVLFYIILQCVMLEVDLLYGICVLKIKKELSLKARLRTGQHFFSTLSGNSIKQRKVEQVESIFINDLKNYRDKYCDGQICIIRSIMRLLAFICLMTRYNFLLGIETIIICLLLAGVSLFGNRVIERISHHMAECRESFMAETIDLVKSRAIYKRAQRDDLFRGKVQSTNEILEDKLFIYRNKLVFINAINTALVTFGIGILLTTGVDLAIHGELQTGFLVSSLSLVSLIEDEVNSITSSILTVFESKGERDRIHDILDVSNIHVEQTDEIYNFGLEHVSYYYDQNEILHDVNMSFLCPGKYLIIGENGTGKSTSLNILTGLISDYYGYVFVNNKTLKPGDTILLEKAAFLSQDFHLFNDTVKNNIVFGNEVSEKRLISSGFLEIVNDYMPRMDLIIEANGSNLSGGQRQVIGMARALSAGKKIIICDESFSAMDPDLFKRIVDFLAHIENICLLVVSHRQMSGISFDSVYTL